MDVIPNRNLTRALVPREAPSPDTILSHNDALGLAIDSETAMAHWHGEPIDYDHAVMVAMYAWGSGDPYPGTEHPPEAHETPPAPSVTAFPPLDRKPLHTPWWLRESSSL